MQLQVIPLYRKFKHVALATFVAVLSFTIAFPYTAHGATILYDGTTGKFPTTANQIANSSTIGDASVGSGQIADGDYNLGSVRTAFAYITSSPSATFHLYLANDGFADPHGRTGTRDCVSQTVTQTDSGAVPWANTGSVTDLSSVVFVFSGTECAFSTGTGTSWQIKINRETGGTDSMYMLSDSSGYSDFAQVYSDVYGASTNTRIDTVSPYDNEIVATSSPTTVGSTGYVSSDDYATGTRLRIKLDRNTDSQAVGALVAWDSAFGNYTDFPIDASGSYSISTTSIANLSGIDRGGQWNMYQVIQKPDLSIFGINLTYKNLVSTSTQYVYGVPTGVDQIASSTTATLETIVGSTDVFGNCQFDFSTVLDFSNPHNILTCVAGVASSLIVPNKESLTALLDGTKNDFITKPPFGYIYLAARALLGYSGVTGTDLADSNVAITFPTTGVFASSSAGSVAGATVTFINWSTLASSMDSIATTDAMSGLYNFLNTMMGVGFLLWLWYFGSQRFIP